MSELPQTDELPRSEGGYDPARVEEAFASFAERVHELESVAGELRAELRALRSQRQRLVSDRAPVAYANEEWPADDEPGQPDLDQSPDWIASVPPPLIRPVAVPRLALEAVFLVLVALFAGLADLSTTSIVILMAAAWALVTLSEWAAAAKRSRWRLDSVAAPGEIPSEGASDSTGPWSMPVVEATVVEAPDDSESHTVVTKLPEHAETPAAEVEVAEPAEPEVLAEAAEAESPELVVAAPEVAEPAPAEAEAEAEVGQPEAVVAEPELVEEEVADPEAIEPELTATEVAEPEMAEGEVVEAQATEPEVAEPDLTEPDLTKSEAPEADAADTDLPELSHAEATDIEDVPPIPPPELEPEPTRRRRFFRRRHEAAESPADPLDPWEA
ncbi:MAG: hypothetical protein WKF41_07200 [Gaiellaceae bacterium]